MKNSREGLIKDRQKRERRGGVRFIRNPHRDRVRRAAERNKYGMNNQISDENE